MTTTQNKKLLSTAFTLSLVTIIYNILESVVSLFFGTQDQALTLSGFGADSFVEVLSGLGIAHMISRMKKSPVTQNDRFENRALKITGTAFYILTASLVVLAGMAIYTRSKPTTTTAGIIISLVSIASMYFLYRAKLNVGQKLHSAPIISDANCTKTCFYLSFILLASSLFYEFFKIPYIDAAGSLGIAWYAFSEGREAFEKAQNKSMSCSDDCC